MKINVKSNFSICEVIVKSGGSTMSEDVADFNGVVPNEEINKFLDAYCQLMAFNKSTDIEIVTYLMSYLELTGRELSEHI